MAYAMLSLLMLEAIHFCERFAKYELQVQLSLTLADRSSMFFLPTQIAEREFFLLLISWLDFSE